MASNNSLFALLRRYSSILEVGPYPPPLGGVSVHISRLVKSLDNCELFDLSQPGGRKFIKLFLSLMLNKRDLVHVHVITLKILSIVLVAQCFKGYVIVVTDHNSRLFEGKTKIQLFLLKYFLRRTNYIVVVGAHILRSYEQHKIKPKENFLISNSFIPPNLSDKKEILKTYPTEYHDFVQSHSPIINTNAYKLILHNGIDLYGIDLCIELICKLRENYPNIGLLFFLADDKYNIEYLNTLKEMISQKNLSKNIIFITDQRELWASYLDSDLMVRATCTDGFGVSIAEALHVGCPAIASDVCQRAPGTILFKNRNFDELYQKSLQMIQSKQRKI